MLLKTCSASNADAELPNILDLAWTSEVKTNKNICSDRPAYLPNNISCKTFRLSNYPSGKFVTGRPFCHLSSITKNTTFFV